jgi:hypothetical protein
MRCSTDWREVHAILPLPDSEGISAAPMVTVSLPDSVFLLPNQVADLIVALVLDSDLPFWNY